MNTVRIRVEDHLMKTLILCIFLCCTKMLFPLSEARIENRWQIQKQQFQFGNKNLFAFAPKTLCILCDNFVFYKESGKVFVKYREIYCPMFTEFKIAHFTDIRFAVSVFVEKAVELSCAGIGTSSAERGASN